jgi:Phage integrase, N-terminal SAM-like domain
MSTISPLRQRMIEDMNARKLHPLTQKGHIRGCKQFAAFLKRAPDTATSEDIRRFQLHLAESDMPARGRASREARWSAPRCSGSSPIPRLPQ